MIKIPLYIKVKNMLPGDILQGREILTIVSERDANLVCLVFSKGWKVRNKNDREWIWRKIF